MHQLVSGTDIIIPIEYGDAVNVPGIYTPIYTAPKAADVIKLTLTIELDPIAHPEPTIDIVALEGMTDLQRAETLRDAVYESNIPFFFLNVWKRVGTKRAPVLKEIPVYNGGRYNEVAELTTYFTNAVLPVAKNSILELQLVDTGSGLLASGERAWLELATVEEEWVEDVEINQLIALVSAQQQQLSAQIATQSDNVNNLISGLTSVINVLGTAIANQSALIELLSTTGINPGNNNNNNNAENSQMRIYYHPGSTLTIDGTALTVPTAPPDPYSTTPATLNGVPLRAGFEITWEKPMNTNEYPQYEETVYTVLPGTGGTLKYVPSRKTIVQSNDGTNQVYSQFWDGTQWIQRGHYL